MGESLGNITAPPDHPHTEDQVTLDMAGSVEVIALNDHTNIGEEVEIQDVGPLRTVPLTPTRSFEVDPLANSLDQPS